MSYQSRLILYNLFNKFLSDISALLLHTCVQLRQPYKLVETTQSFLQCRYQSTPLYLYIHNIKLVCKSGTLCAGLERETVVYTQPHINLMVNRVSFFKSTRPKLLQIGQTRYQSTPLYLYIHNCFLALVHVHLCWIGTGKSSLHTISSLTSVATVTMVPIKMTTLVGGWKHGNIHCIC